MAGDITMQVPPSAVYAVGYLHVKVTFIYRLAHVVLPSTIMR
jgi:hypothetical protein